MNNYGNGGPFGGQPGMAVNMFAGLKDAQVFERGNYFQQGVYDVRVVRCIHKQTYRSGMGFIVELEVVTSNNPAHEPGSTGSWFQNMSKNQATAFGAIKEFLAALHGFDPKSEAFKTQLEPHIERIAAEAVSPANSLMGKPIHLETFITKTREKNTDFTVHKWSPYTGPALPAMTPRALPTAPAQGQPAAFGGAPPGFPSPAVVPGTTIPGFAPQGIGFVPQGSPTGPAPQGPPPGFGNHFPAPPGFAPQGVPPGFAPQGPPPGFAPQAPRPAAGPPTPILDPVTGQWRLP